LRIVAEAATALRAANAVGLRHFNLKPNNILFADDDRAQLADFAAAKGPGDGFQQLSDGRWACYQAPEVERNLPSDIYALGALLYHMVSGQAPFVGEDAKAAAAARNGHTPDVRELNDRVSPRTAALIGTCLKSNPEERYASPTDLLMAVEHARTTETASD
jgi:serine/threonine-protein kinase